MLIIPPAKFRGRRGRVEYGAAAAVPAVVPLVLVSASYDADGQTLTMGFDRPIDLSKFDGTQIVVNDGDYDGYAYEATGGAYPDDPQTLFVYLTAITSAQAPGIWVTATGTTGIAAVDDGGLWPGVTELALPF